jgi:hypothetical protein
MESEKIITSVFAGKPHLSVVGTVPTHRIHFEEGCIPTLKELTISWRDGEYVLFGLQEPIGEGGGPFSKIKVLKIRYPIMGLSAGNEPEPLKEIDRIGNTDEFRRVWRILFWHFRHEKRHYPKMSFEGFIRTDSECKGGYVDMKVLSLGSLEAALKLPGFRWSKNINNVLKAKSILLKRDLNLQCIFESGVDSSGIAKAAKYEKPRLFYVEDQGPTFFLSSLDSTIPIVSFGLDLTYAIRSPDVEITWV